MTELSLVEGLVVHNLEFLSKIRRNFSLEKNPGMFLFAEYLTFMKVVMGDSHKKMVCTMIIERNGEKIMLLPFGRKDIDGGNSRSFFLFETVVRLLWEGLPLLESFYRSRFGV